MYIQFVTDSLGLHRVENSSTVNPAISLHLYSPPFSSCSVFNKQTGQKSSCKVTFWSEYGDKRNRVRLSPIFLLSLISSSFLITLLSVNIINTKSELSCN